MERLYCPDFSSVFSQQYANPFFLPNTDAQLWPVLDGIDFPSEVENLLSLKSDDTNVFYRRKITLDQLNLELEASSIQTVIFQALELGEEYGITNDFTMQIAKKVENSKVLCSIYPQKGGLMKLKEIYKQFKKLIAGFVIYPNYQSEFLNSSDFDEVIKWINKSGLPLKIDLTDLHLNKLPPTQPVDLSESLYKIFQKLTSIPIILSCGDWYTLTLFIDRYKFQRNIYLELNMRMLGGQSPTQFFKNLFDIPGFIQNWWSRILLSSGSPTLETSQLVRGWYEATECLDMNFQHLLRIWGFRNSTRIFSITPLEAQQKSNYSYQLGSEFSNSLIIHLGYDIFVQSFSVTQLISIQSIVHKIFAEIKKKHPKTQSGSITIKSYHTTVSLITNEHEIGNYLELHYHFAKESMVDSQKYLHTVAAKENRADFNFPDHLIASTYGKRTITYHIRNGSISKGSREHVYVLGTFGPRQMRIGMDIILHKE